MSSTVTTLTVSTVNSTNLFPIMALILVITLLLLLIEKEIVTTSSHRWAVTLTKVLNVALIPLFLAFGMIALASLLQLLR